MTAESWLRLLLVFGHLLLCVQVLHLVVRTDRRVLRRRVSERSLRQVHRQVGWLLAGLWLTGLAVLLIDYGGQWALLLQRPKLLAKLSCVLVLTANAALLHVYALPRLSAGRMLGRAEMLVLSAAGGISSASWLMAAFIGVARPMASWTTLQALGLYGLALAVGVAVALWLCPPRLARRQLQSGLTAVEEAAETLDGSAAARLRA